MPERSVRPTSRPASVSDEETMHRVAGGDSGAFRLLSERWRLPIERLCFRATGDWQEAEDLAQETFVRLFESRESYRPLAKFSTYLWRIALNLCHDHRRRVGRQVQVVESDSPLIETKEDELPARIVGMKEDARHVKDALDRLPEIYRTVLVLRHYERLKLREVAEVLEIPEGTVSSRMAEALRRLSRMLRKR